MGVKTMKKNEYKCCNCKGIFTKGWTDEEALEEYKEAYNDKELKRPMAVVCDDCYNEKKRVVNNG